MRNFNLVKYFGLIMVLVITTTFTGCVDDNDDTEAPFLKITPATLSFKTDGTPADGGQNYFEISTNRHWKATVKDNKSWVILSKTEGEGNAKVEVSIPENINDEATVIIEVANKVGTLMSETITIKSGSISPMVILFHETIGTTDVSAKPFVDAYTGWNKSGIGATNVTYSGANVSIRNSGLANTGAYDGASGPNVLFFGTAPANFVIGKIALTAEQRNLKLVFGGSYSFKAEGSTEYDNKFDISKFTISLSTDGTNWIPLTYVKNDGDTKTPYWVLGYADFTLKAATSELYIKFATSAASAFRLDDITLTTGNGGQEIDLNGSVTPGEAKEITIPELITMTKAAGSTQTPIDVTSDRFFYGIVQSDVAGGNYNASNLPLAVEGATTGNNAVTLYGSIIDPKTLNLTKGDKVKVTLVKGLANTVLYSGLYEITGANGATWAIVEKVGTATITPVVITADNLLDYQGMTVTIKNAATTAVGAWDTGTTTHAFTADGTTFAVFCKTGSTAFAGQVMKATTGSITGIITIYKGTPQVAPRNLNDTEAFNSSAPTITAVTPSSISLTSTGGSSNVAVSVANQGSNAITVSGLTGNLSASVNGTTVTVTAVANTNDAAIKQTLTISIANGNSVEIPITIAGKPAAGTQSFTMTAQNIVDGKTGDVALATNGYGSQAVATPVTWYTWSSNNINFTGVKIGISSASNGGGIQVQGHASTSSSQGRIANVTALPSIQTIEIILKVVTTSSYDPAYHVYAGSSANPSSADATITGSSTVETVDNFKVYTQTFDLSSGNYSYFNIMNDLAGAIYIDSIKITYKN